MISILLCHFVPHHPNAYVQMSAQFFNIGVQIFFILSGFLFGTQGEICDIRKWCTKRLIRIYIPWILFVVILAFIHITLGKNILTWNWLKLLFGLQGTHVGVEGAGQTWFVTCLLICYLATPILNQLSRHQQNVPLIITLAIWPALLAMLTNQAIFTLLSPLSWYGIAYLYGRHFNTNHINSKSGIIGLSLAIIALMGRFLIKTMTTNTIVYDQIVVGYSQAIAAAGIIFSIAWLTKEKYPGKSILLFSSISFEIYLYHYMLSAGPISLFSLTPYWTINALIITLIASSIAYITNKIANSLSVHLP